MSTDRPDTATTTTGEETTMSSDRGVLASGRHPVSIGHLVMGLAFVGLVGVWALFQGGAIAGDDLHWLLPIPWVAAGLAGLLATTLTSRRRSRDRWATRQTGWVTQPAPPATDDSLDQSPDDTTEENR